MFQSESAPTRITDNVMRHQGRASSRYDIHRRYPVLHGSSETEKDSPRTVVGKTENIPIANKDQASPAELAKIKEAQNRDTRFYNRINGGMKTTDVSQSCHQNDFLLQQQNGHVKNNRHRDFGMQNDCFIGYEDGPSIDYDTDDEAIFELEL
ncbi:unnamed protein product [Cylindrotheca closterium]|uniref:Uncharacterized protein n=1 Tax=Cylindrotheca closterium TaxID=2856 RepID=A0AAD2FXK9_9STRA|nr:unnamed protein product [Cylindrotheca closterium]